MTRKSLPALQAPSWPPKMREKPQFNVSRIAFDAWNPGLRASAEDDATSIPIFDPIGFDPWTGEGVTAKRIAGVLRSLRGKDVTVNINSPGGDLFEGIAIYNLLREHDGQVTARVLGVAASAASIIAMGADRIEIGLATWLMVHNGWVVTMGNRHDLRAVADWIEPFDRSVAEVYSARTGIPVDEVAAQMDTEAWIGGRDAVDSGWADGLLPADAVTEKGDDEQRGVSAARKLDVILARAGLPRSQRRELLSEFRSTPRAASGVPGMRGAAEPGADEASQLAANLVAMAARLRAAAVAR